MDTMKEAVVPLQHEPIDDLSSRLKGLSRQEQEVLLQNHMKELQEQQVRLQTELRAQWSKIFRTLGFVGIAMIVVGVAIMIVVR